MPKEKIHPSNLTEREKEILLIYADCNMRANAVSKKIFVSCSGVFHFLDAIYRKTGKNPRRFYDLVFLVTSISGDDV